MKRLLKRCRTASFRGLTLIELLVVIVIVGFLAAALRPAGTGGHQKGASIAKARVAMSNLYMAIRAYESDYRRWPVSTNVESSGLADFTFGTIGTKSSVLVTNGGGIEANNAEVISILLDITSFRNGTLTPNHGSSLNPRHLVMLNASMANQEEPGVGVDGVYRDPWGNPYIITLDLNHDGKCGNAFYTLPSKSTSSMTNGVTKLVGPTNTDSFNTAGKMMIWSLGPDGKADSHESAKHGVNKDNVISWE